MSDHAGKLVTNGNTLAAIAAPEKAAPPQALHYLARDERLAHLQELS